MKKIKHRKKKSKVVHVQRLQLTEVDKDSFVVEINGGGNFAGVVGLDDDGKYIYRNGKANFKSHDGLDAIKEFLGNSKYTDTGDDSPLFGRVFSWRTGAWKRFGVERLPVPDEFAGVSKQNLEEAMAALEELQQRMNNSAAKGDDFHIDW